MLFQYTPIDDYGTPSPNWYCFAISIIGTIIASFIALVITTTGISYLIIHGILHYKDDDLAKKITITASIVVIITGFLASGVYWLWIKHRSDKNEKALNI